MLLKFAVTTILVLSAAVNLADAQGGCSHVATRKEIRDLSLRERQAFLRAMRKVGEGRRPNIYNQLATVHVRNQNTIHGYPVFLIWHRVFARFFEEELLKVDSSIALHYWDWTKDARNPERSEILGSRSFFGGSTRGECLDTPNFPKWQAYNPSPHCLARIYVNGNTPGPFYPRAITDEIRRQSRTYDYYRIRLEGGPHAAPHNGCGGDLASMQSPEDPIFFIHHSFVDKLYFEWQRDDWSQRRSMYNGVNYNGRPARLTDQLSGLGYSVGQCLDISRLCYRYQNTGSPRDKGRVGDLPIMLAIPPEEAARMQREQAQRSRSGQRLVRRSYAAVAAPESSHDSKPAYSAKPSNNMEHPRSAPDHDDRKPDNGHDDNHDDRKPAYKAKPDNGNDDNHDDRKPAYKPKPDNGHDDNHGDRKPAHKSKPDNGRDDDHDRRPANKDRDYRPDHGHDHDNDHSHGHGPAHQDDEDCDDDNKPSKKVKHVVQRPKNMARPENKAVRKAKPAYVAKVAPTRHVMVERPVEKAPRKISKVYKKAPKPVYEPKDVDDDEDEDDDDEYEVEYEPEPEPEYEPEAKAEIEAEEDYNSHKTHRQPHPAATRFILDIPTERIEAHANEYDEEMFHPLVINEKWLKMNNIDVKTQRKLEQSYCGIIDKVNVVIKKRCDDGY